GEEGDNPGAGRVLHDAGQSAEAGKTGVLLALASPSGLALDATYVYATSPSGVLGRVLRLGGAAGTLAGDLKTPAAIALAGGQLFFLDATGISRMTLPQSDVTAFASDAIDPSAIAATPTDVYWVELQQRGSTAMQVATRPAVGGAKRLIATHVG